MGRLFTTMRIAIMLLGVSAAVPGQLARAAELVMFERAGCPYCLRWDQEVAPAYAKSAESHIAPLRRHDLAQGQPKHLRLAAPVRFSPTFVLIDKNREIGRITGYFDNAIFWGMLVKLMEKLPNGH